MCISWFVLEASYEKISKERTETMFRNSKAGEGSSEGACNSGMPDPSLRWTRWKACQQRSKHPLENWVVGSLGNTHCVLKISHASFHISQESWEELLSLLILKRRFYVEAHKGEVTVRWKEGPYGSAAQAPSLLDNEIPFPPGRTKPGCWLHKGHTYLVIFLGLFTSSP